MSKAGMKNWTVPALRSAINYQGVAAPKKGRKAELYALLKKIKRAETIRSNYLDQNNGRKLTPAQKRRMLKATHRVWGMLASEVI